MTDPSLPQPPFNEAEDVEISARIQLFEKELRIRRAAMFEWTISFLISSTLIYIAYEQQKIFDGFQEAPILSIVRNTNTIIALFLIFIQTLIILLTNHTLIVGIIVIFPSVEIELIEHIREIITAKPSSAETNPLKSKIFESSLASVLKNQKHRLDSISHEITADAHLRKSLERSAEATNNARSRPTALLFAGSVVSVLGILIFILTLPPTYLPIEDWPKRAIEVAPRLFLFLFIQVLAGFFLRQYRISLEDYRYYESILRHREDQLSSLLIRREQSDSEAISEFAKIILENREFLKISNGDSSFIIEAQKIEKNEFSSLADIILNLMKSSEGSKNEKK